MVKITFDIARVRAVFNARLTTHIIHAGARAGVVAVLRRRPGADLDELVFPDGVIVKSRFLTRRKPVAPEFGEQRFERVIDRQATALFELIFDRFFIDIKTSFSIFMHFVFPHLPVRGHAVDVIELDRYMRPLIITFLAAIHINSAIAHKQCAEMAYIRAICLMPSETGLIQAELEAVGVDYLIARFFKTVETQCGGIIVINFIFFIPGIIFICQPILAMSGCPLIIRQTIFCRLHDPLVIFISKICPCKIDEQICVNINIAIIIGQFAAITECSFLPFGTQDMCVDIGPQGAVDVAVGDGGAPTVNRVVADIMGRTKEVIIPGIFCQIIFVVVISC